MEVTPTVPAVVVPAENQPQVDTATPTPENDTKDKQPVAGETTPPVTPPVPDFSDTEKDEEPPVRKSKLDYILERKQAKLRKQEESIVPQKPAPSIETPDDSNVRGNEGDDEPTPDEVRKFQRFMEKTYGDKLSRIDQLAETTEAEHVNSEVSEFLKNDPHADLLPPEFSEKIKKYAQHPSRKQVPLEEIVWGIAGKKLIAYAAEAVRAAQKAAAKTRTGGSPSRKPEGDTTGTPDFANMPTEEFKKYQAQVLRSR